MLKQCLILIGVIIAVQAARPADANDLMRLYRLALARDTTIRSAMYQRDAAIEARPQALSQWLPQLAGTASREREFIAEQAAEFGISSNGSTPLGSIGEPGCRRRSRSTSSGAGSHRRSHRHSIAGSSHRCQATEDGSTVPSSSML
ncbi:MAG: hypothetical protein WBE92_00745 [Steroidobacteraceae bacterium]